MSARRALLGASALAAGGLLLVGADPAAAAVHAPGIAAVGIHIPSIPTIIKTVTNPIGTAVSSVFHSITGAALGAFSWTISLASKFILVTLAALIKLLIPRSWAHEGVEVFQWIVAVPDFTGKISSPSGKTSYGFAGVNDIRQVLEWIGLGMLPLTLVLATGRTMVGQGDPVAAPIARVVSLGAVLTLYTFIWGQAVAIVNQVTAMILSPAQVTDGIQQLMAYAVEGVALGGWQLIDLALMGTIALELLALIFVKVVVLIAGACLYATGPAMIGIAPSESGSNVARGWLTAAAGYFMLPILWATVFAIGAVLIGDSQTAGPLVAGTGDVAKLLGGVIVAVAGTATLWLSLKLVKETASILRTQLGAILAVGTAGRNRGTDTTDTSTGGGQSQRAASSIRTFQNRVSRAGTAALTAAPGGPGLAAGLSLAGRYGQRGLIRGGGQLAGSAMMGGARAAGRTGPVQAAAARLRDSDTGTRTGRAGAVASRMARAGTASWRATRPQKTAASTNSTSAPTAASKAGGKRTTRAPDRPHPTTSAASSLLVSSTGPRRPSSGAQAPATPASGTAADRQRRAPSPPANQHPTGREQPTGPRQTSATSHGTNGPRPSNPRGGSSGAANPSPPTPATAPGAGTPRGGQKPPRSTPSPRPAHPADGGTPPTPSPRTEPDPPRRPRPGSENR